MTREMWMAFARHCLTATGAVFVAKGQIDAETMNTIVGAVISLGSVGWSLFDKKQK
jgi:hypothetical protein